MFGISLIEFFTIIILGLIIINPKEYPALIAKFSALYRELKKAYCVAMQEINNVKEQVNLAEESKKLKDDIANLDQDIKQILGDDGKLYDAYDISDLVKKDEES